MKIAYLKNKEEPFKMMAKCYVASDYNTELKAGVMMTTMTMVMIVLMTLVMMTVMVLVMEFWCDAAKVG